MGSDAWEIHDQAVLLHEQHAKRAMELGDVAMARRADARAGRARHRARLARLQTKHRPSP